MKVRFAMWLMRRHVFKHLPERIQNWAIEQYLMTFASYRRYRYLQGMGPR